MDSLSGKRTDIGSVTAAAGCGKMRSMVLFIKAFLVVTTVVLGSMAQSQVEVLTAHNDIGRTGQNPNEQILTWGNVNGKTFGKLFSYPIAGVSQTQPLYVPNLTLPNAGKHNVIFVGTSQDYVYAFDADSNGGNNANSLWERSLLATAPPNSRANGGVIGTPVIDLSSNTLFVVSSDELPGAIDIARLHALDLITGAEKFGGPLSIQATVAGTGVGSVGGKLKFDPQTQVQRPGLLLLNGVLYVAFGAQNDVGAWHGWIFSYKAADLTELNVFCDSPNGSGGGIWMGGAGLAAELNDPNRPFGRMFLTTGNGSFNASRPYNGSMSYGMSFLDLDLTGGKMTVQDTFTPHNWSSLNAHDGDVGSGGIILLPQQHTTSGETSSPLLQASKYGILYVLDRNELGGLHGTDQVIQEVATPEGGQNGWGLGVWGSLTYWNQNVYFGGSGYAPLGSYRASNPLTDYSFIDGKLSTVPMSSTAEEFAFPGPTPSVSSNGTKDGIVWALKNDAYPTNGSAVLLAWEASNLANQLYSSADNPNRDDPGMAAKFTVPTIANGKVYVAINSQLGVYGLLSTPRTATPEISPGSSSFSGSITITINDSTPGASIYYTIDGVTSHYTGPFTLNGNETVTAYAGAAGYVQSASVSQTFTDASSAANPTFSLSSGSYVGTQQLTLSDSSADSHIYYSMVNTTPLNEYALYTGPISVSVSETVQAYAAAANLTQSSVVSGSYTIAAPYAIDYPQGFSNADGPISFNGSTGLDDFRLQLTNGGIGEAGSAFYATPVNVRSFTTDFTFQLSNPAADGITFTIQNVGSHALGGGGSNLGYGGLDHSVALKFDLYNDAGEGQNSTGIFVNGAEPTNPSIDLAGTAINLHSGDYIDAHITYDGTTLTVTLTDELTSGTWSHFYVIDIPKTIGSTTGYVGFTGGTGSETSSQKLTSWTYLEGPQLLPNYPVGFDGRQLWMNGSTVEQTSLQVTNGRPNRKTSTYFDQPVDIRHFTSSFDLRMTDAEADGFTFLLQNGKLTALGNGGGDLGYATLAKSIAIKFDIFNDAGEGSDSTGVYVNGAEPILPAQNLAAHAIALRTGHIFHVGVTYDGTTLAWTIKDQLTQANASYRQTIDIPRTVEGNTAYAGFTGSTNNKTSTQQILNWTLNNP